MQRHFGIAGRARGKIEDHRIIRVCGHAFKILRGFLHLGHKIIPAVALAVDHELHLPGRALRRGFVKMRGHVALPGADDRLDGGGIDAIDDIVLCEQKGGGDDDGAELVQRKDRKPELIVAL